MEPATTIQLLGAGAFGFLVGWFVYYLNRHRSADVRFADLVSLIGAIGGGAVLALFPAGTDLFGAYGLGLFAGFFGYLLVLLLLVWRSENFTIDYLIDGRRRDVAPGERLPDGPDRGAMGDPEHNDPGHGGPRR
jgi:hypothetical protein